MLLLKRIKNWLLKKVSYQTIYFESRLSGIHLKSENLVNDDEQVIETYRFLNKQLLQYQYNFEQQKYEVLREVIRNYVMYLDKHTNFDIKKFRNLV